MELVSLQSLQSILIPTVILKVLEKVRVIFQPNFGSFKFTVLRNYNSCKGWLQRHAYLVAFL